MEVVFQKRKFKLVVTEHAQQRMALRALSLDILVDVVQNGTALKKAEANKFWVYKTISGRDDNTVCLSVSIEDPHLVVITALVNWRPHQ
jgi:hypothetical protein